MRCNTQWPLGTESSVFVWCWYQVHPSLLLPRSYRCVPSDFVCPSSPLILLILHSLRSWSSSGRSSCVLRPSLSWSWRLCWWIRRYVLLSHLSSELSLHFAGRLLLPAITKPRYLDSSCFSWCAPEIAKWPRILAEPRIGIVWQAREWGDKSEWWRDTYRDKFSLGLLDHCHPTLGTWILYRWRRTSLRGSFLQHQAYPESGSSHTQSRASTVHRPRSG